MCGVGGVWRTLFSDHMNNCDTFPDKLLVFLCVPALFLGGEAFSSLLKVGLYIFIFAQAPQLAVRLLTGKIVVI